MCPIWMIVYGDLFLNLLLVNTLFPPMGNLQQSKNTTTLITVASGAILSD